MFKKAALVGALLLSGSAHAQSVYPPVYPPAQIIASILALNNTWTGHNTYTQDTTAASVNKLIFNFDPSPFITPIPGSGPDVDNVYVGTTEPTMVTTGGNITALGRNAGASVSSGYSGTYVGYDAAQYLTTAYEVTAVGDHALQYCTSCNASTALGQSALNYATTAVNNTGLGWNALYTTTTSYNTAVGKAALSHLSYSGGENTAVGESAGVLANGMHDTFIGQGAGEGNLPGAIAVTGGTCIGTTETLTGSWAKYGPGSIVYLQSVTGATGLNASSNSPGTGIFGGWIVTSASSGSVTFTVPNCTSLYAWTGGDGGTLYVNSYNDQGDTAVGYLALTNIGITDGAGTGFNTAMGWSSGYGLTTGFENILIGASLSSASQNQVTTGDNNISIGFDVAVPSATGNNQLDIGNFLYCTGLSGTGTSISPGSCGFGVKAPAATLEVNGNFQTDGGMVSKGAGGTLTVFATTVSAITSTTAGALYINANGSSPNVQLQAGGTTEMFVYASGEVQTPNLPTSAGGGGLYICVDSSGNQYKKSTCP